MIFSATASSPPVEEEDDEEEFDSACRAEAKWEDRSASEAPGGSRFFSRSRSDWDEEFVARGGAAG